MPPQVSAGSITYAHLLDQGGIVQTALPNGQAFLEFMKVPLLSSYNILLASGPRVRVRQLVRD